MGKCEGNRTCNAYTFFPLRIIFTRVFSISSLKMKKYRACKYICYFPFYLRMERAHLCGKFSRNIPACVKRAYRLMKNVIFPSLCTTKPPKYINQRNQTFETLNKASKLLILHTLVETCKLCGNSCCAKNTRVSFVRSAF